MVKYCTGEFPSHKRCLFKLSCSIKLIEDIKKASGEEHIHQPVMSSSCPCVTSSGLRFPAGRAQSIISHYTDYHPLVLPSTGVKFKPTFVVYQLAIHILDLKQIYNT